MSADPKPPTDRDLGTPAPPSPVTGDAERLAANEERARKILRGAGIEDHHGGDGESYYARPAWHMAEELVALWNDPMCLADKLDSIAGEDESAASAVEVEPDPLAELRAIRADVDAVTEARREHGRRGPMARPDEYVGEMPSLEYELAVAKVLNAVRSALAAADRGAES